MNWEYPTTTHPGFRDLGGLVQKLSVPNFAPDMPGTLMAQWALESGWGRSELASKHRNYAGMKWRDMMAPFASPVEYAAHDGRERYCHFDAPQDFVDGYFHRLDNFSPYRGWRRYAERGGADFITFIGPIWLGLSAAKNQEYVRKVMALQDLRFAHT